MKNYLLLFLLLKWCVVTAISQESILKIESSATPVLFTETSINTPMNERDIAISPDGTEMFYTVYLQPTQFHTIIYCKKEKNGKWSSPKVASFSGMFSDMEPAFTSDGQKVFFSSNRPDGSLKKMNYDIWYAEKINGVWMNPKNIGAPVNTSEDEFFPSIAANGNLYFTAARKDGVGKEDIYMSRQNGGKYTQPVALDTGVNTGFYEFNAFVSPDEQYILFTSFGRKDDKGRGDIYMSSKDGKGNWRPAKNVWLINSEKLDYCPFVSFDHKTLFFTSERHTIPESFRDRPVFYDQLKALFNQVQNGTGNIYQISWEAVKQSVQ